MFFVFFFIFCEAVAVFVVLHMMNHQHATTAASLFAEGHVGVGIEQTERAS